jgi:hypothetical protein
MWVYIILAIVVGIILFFTEIGRAILKAILKIVIVAGLLYLSYLFLKFMIHWTSNI